ncbi:hypothetical protein SAMN04489729_4831 [Amycolatopsis lurida]|uniref:Uncharacterized protein n=1 Tax=Amycolatopsis lurida NRRL 2430 TaxID=1460371 RepID=A0A2P2FW81_AMYLU|nr:hypothetical protein [Amycolatopsis lurida]KFU80997.1 hypothetical protein BB31_11480 [Amycolatopsis lurida NRRL 2430]SED61130.1 hypothetical protein SAMN04489729_4831 [Amycolatopsis lurida]
MAARKRVRIVALDRAARVLVDGVDISGVVSGVEISLQPQQPAEVTLRVPRANVVLDGLADLAVVADETAPPGEVPTS